MSAVLAFESPGKPVLRGIEHFWKVIRELDETGPWAIHDVWVRSEVRHQATVSDFVRRLVAAGMVAKTGETRRVPFDGRSLPLYRLQGNKPARAPRLRRDGTAAQQGRGQQQMWTVMRGPLARDGFTFHDLALWGSTDESPVARNTAQAYVQRLADAGYLVQVHAGGPQKPTVWRLKPAMNTGPRPPLVLRAQIVFDQNRMTAAPFEAEEVKP